VSQIHRQLVFVLLALVVNPLVGWSHPGHGTTAQSVDSLSPAHYLIEPVHALPIAVVIAIVLLAAASLGRSRLAARLTSRAR
jgi:hypothetical protein